MTEQILLPPGREPARKFWKPWKWVGLAVYAAALLFSQKLPPAVVAVAYAYGIVVLANLLFAIFRYLGDRIFWRVRTRLIGSFVFVAVIPPLILLGIVAMSGYVLFARMATQYLNAALQESNRSVSEIGYQLAEQLSSDPMKLFQVKAASILSAYSNQFPSISAQLLQRTPGGGLQLAAKYDPKAILPEVKPQPGNKWLGSASFLEGIVGDGERIFLTSLRPIPGLPEFSVALLVPLDNSVADRLRQEKSIYAIFVPEEDAKIDASDKGVRITLPEDKRPESAQKAAEDRVNQQQLVQQRYLDKDSRRMIFWTPYITGKVYQSGESAEVGQAVLRVPWSVILESYMGGEIAQSLPVKVLYILGILFACAALISIVIGFTISRRVTGSVHDLYKGILALQKGDLLHRIPVRRKDQLGLLAHSFNQMTASISGLMEEVVEKKRLEKELEIAREVQANLFPKQLPHSPGMDIFGGCKPARVVSGDYYDFIIEDESHLNIVVGDISGKGISAALLMANLQAAMRGQILSARHDDPEEIGKRLAEVMKQLNRQIYLSSPPEKYATLFLGRYDADAHRLWYCNAGHLPPMVLEKHGTRTLEPTGTVIGLFPNADYEAKSIELASGTVLAIFTDGVTEAVNKADEEFGEKRLLEELEQSRVRVPERIWEHVISKVAEWQSDLPQYDDITLIVAKTA